MPTQTQRPYMEQRGCGGNDKCVTDPPMEKYHHVRVIVTHPRAPPTNRCDSHTRLITERLAPTSEGSHWVLGYFRLRKTQPRTQLETQLACGSMSFRPQAAASSGKQKEITFFRNEGGVKEETSTAEVSNMTGVSDRSYSSSTH